MFLIINGGRPIYYGVKNERRTEARFWYLNRVVDDKKTKKNRTNVPKTA
jgi:hypothetical protein